MNGVHMAILSLNPPAEKLTAEKLMTKEEVCQVLEISRTSLWRLERGGRKVGFPKSLKVRGMGTRYRKSEIEAFLQKAG